MEVIFRLGLWLKTRFIAISKVIIAIPILYKLLYRYDIKCYISGYEWLSTPITLILKKLPWLMSDCNLPIFTDNETITNLAQYESSQEQSDLLKAGLYFSIQPDKILKSKIFTTFEKIHRSFLNNLTSKETKSQIKVHLWCLGNSCFYNYEPSPRILSQDRLLQKLRKKKYIFCYNETWSRKWCCQGDQQIYKNAIEEINSDTSKFKKLNEDLTLKREASRQRFLHDLKQKNIFNEYEYDIYYSSGSAPAGIYGTPKMHKFSTSDSFPKLRPIVSSIGTFNYQCNFTKGFFTQYPLVSTPEIWKGAVDNKKVFVAHLMDLCKAFDCLSHELIIAKLNAYGFSFLAVLFMIIYLTGNKELILIMISLDGKKLYFEYLKVLCFFFSMKETEFLTLY